MLHHVSRSTRAARLLVLLWLLVAAASPVWAGERFITVASTTSTESSGLFDYLLPIFTKRTGIEVRVVAVGTGQALKLAERGDADVLLVHHRASEEAFVAAGHGLDRRDVMFNDFVVVGPKDDPAGVRGAKDVEAAFAAIARAKAPFTSRGDDSGTHKRELEIWSRTGIEPTAASGEWYRETGSGMGATLNTAQAMGAYCLTDRGTWLRFANKGALSIVYEHGASLRNDYGVILVSPERHSDVKAKDGQAFVDWLVSEDGQGAIAAFQIHGQPAFFPAAR